MNGTVTISTARTTPSGTDVTVTIEAEAPGAENKQIPTRFQNPSRNPRTEPP